MKGKNQKRVKVVENLKRLQVSNSLQKKKKKKNQKKNQKKKKITPLLSIAVILSSYEHIVEKELWCESCGYLFYCSFYQVFSQFALIFHI